MRIILKKDKMEARCNCGFKFQEAGLNKLLTDFTSGDKTVIPCPTCGYVLVKSISFIDKSERRKANGW